MPRIMPRTFPALGHRIVLALGCLCFAFCLSPPARAEDEPAIGRLNTGGYRITEMCTATLIAPDRALTAAHCVTRPEDGYLKRLTDMVFVAGWDGSSHKGAARIKAVHVHPQAFSGGRFDLGHDIAVIDLDETLAPTPLRIGSAALPGPLTLMGYRRSRPHRLTVTPLCYGSEAYGIWRIGCRVEPGQSGGPVLFGDGAARRIVGVIVAVTRDEEALVVPLDNWARQQLSRR
ncbi:trypsin-like serine peptidase [Antarctobacter heliothermus]|uniref:Trypsin-like peptidase domain-containing protein n=1 Tax=Antarctobacter heliothermus TaxID=74033 RepID=A0A239FD17_9RHOB|nr:trypsin-like peptidase domain-containing protein [Antarctobacter heliothermus]SNS54631.1 Trypsin-like peptidase domain-containing protein [Antarctobacter heliothermus]